MSNFLKLFLCCSIPAAVFFCGCKKDAINQVVDADGNVYQTVQIGTQTWMAENLRTASYRNGDLLLTGLNNADWVNVNEGAYCVYDDNIANDPIYGKLYNGQAINDPRGLCPIGWHVPTEAEWNVLIDYLGGTASAGGSLKSTSFLWGQPNAGATNGSGFSALPAGDRQSDGSYHNLGSVAFFWSMPNLGNAWILGLIYSLPNVYSSTADLKPGLSCRCIKD